jgi:hypothetical protein
VLSRPAVPEFLDTLDGIDLKHNLVRVETSPARISTSYAPTTYQTFFEDQTFNLADYATEYLELARELLPESVVG